MRSNIILYCSVSAMLLGSGCCSVEGENRKPLPRRSSYSSLKNVDAGEDETKSDRAELKIFACDLPTLKITTKEETENFINQIVSEKDSAIELYKSQILALESMQKTLKKIQEEKKIGAQKIEELEKQLKAAEKNIQNTKSSDADNKIQFERVERELKNENEKLKNENEKLKGKLDVAQGDSERFKEEAEALDINVKHKEDEIGELKEEIKKLNKKVENLKEENEQLNDDHIEYYTKYRNKLEALKEALEKIDAAVLAIAERVQTLLKELDELLTGGDKDFNSKKSTEQVRIVSKILQKLNDLTKQKEGLLKTKDFVREQLNLEKEAMKDLNQQLAEIKKSKR